MGSQTGSTDSPNPANTVVPSMSKSIGLVTKSAAPELAPFEFDVAVRHGGHKDEPRATELGGEAGQSLQ
jgi:hypothetical protein